MSLENHTEKLSGSVLKIVYRNQENGYAVFVLSLSTKHEVTARGIIPNIQPGEHILISGSWVVHPKFGKQFEAISCTVERPTSTKGLIAYLGSGLIKGIGPAYAEKLVTYFGKAVLDIIDKEPQRLKEVPGIGQKRAETIIDAWIDQREISHIMLFLQEKGISTTYAVKIFKQYGTRAIDLIIENPYRLAEDIWGIGFKMADDIAQNMGMRHDSPKRCRAGILHVLATDIGFGHVYVELNALKTKTAELLEISLPDHAHIIKTAFHALYNDEKIKLISKQNEHFVTTNSNYWNEKNIALCIDHIRACATRHPIDIEHVYTQLRTQNENIALNEDQQKGILTCLQEKITIITGGPGTGKTTLIKQLLTILDAHKIAYRLAAPTGRAAKRITESTKKEAVTIHRLLEFDPATMRFTRNESNALALDFLILDEASMIDIFLASSLLKAVPRYAHVIFIGDVDQLPSVGAGNVLNDLIATQKIPTIRLTQIFRQAQDSMIIVNAHRINNGEFPVPQISSESKKDFLFIKQDDPAGFADILKELLAKKLRAAHIPFDETMVLSPMNRGITGTYALNHTMQTFLNTAEQKSSLTYGGYTYREGDRVMHIKNNYDKNVFNGDIGIVQTIDTSDHRMHVRYPDRTVPYEQSELDELVLAYAISIHKSQGSEYQAVIIPLFMGHFMMLQRNLLYTAVTRAKKLCIIVGQARALAMAIKNCNKTERLTLLKEYLTSDLSCR